VSTRGTILGVSVANVRLALGAGLTLFTLLAGHTILEVARDSLFLATLPASDLPFTYLAIAIAAYFAARVDRGLSERLEQRRLAMLTLLIAGAGTVGFYFAFDSDQWWVWWIPHLFYVWTGLVSTFAVAQFWRLLAELFTVGDAKRLYSRIAAGGSLGAVAGASVATVAESLLAPRGLLLVGAGLLVATSFIPGLLFPPVPPAPRDDARSPTAPDAAEARAYVWRLLGLVALAAVTAILVDYVFKATIDAELEPHELGPFFSRFYVVLNVVSLIVQILLAPRLLRSLGATRSLAILPLLFALGSVGFAVTGALAAAIALRGADGALRHSLHRSGFELLYLPLSSAARARYKTLIDALGQRGGQAVGSLIILGVTWLGVGLQQMGVAIGALAVAWFALVLRLRPRYLDRFRANLRAGSIETRVEVPQLDLGSLESLIASLNSSRDEEVLATLDVLVGYDRVQLIPALLLYHPSRPVVLRTLEVLASSPRTDYVPIARRLLEDEDPEVQAAAMNAIAGSLPEDELREELEHGHDLAVRAAVLVALVSRGLDRAGDAAAELHGCAHNDDPLVRVALARAVRLRPDPQLAPYLEECAQGAPAALEVEIARAYGALADGSGMEQLILWLGPRATRHEARNALEAIGDPAFEALVDALADDALGVEVRAHIPRSLSRFRTERCAEALFSRLLEEPELWIRYKILRALRPLREAMPQLRFDADEMARLVRWNIERAGAVLASRVAVAKGQADDPARLTAGGELLGPVLADKEHQALDRTVRLVALLRPNEDLRRITNALRHGDRRRRAESRELVTALTPAGLGPALDALLDDAPDADRLARLRDSIPVPDVEGGYEGVLRALLSDDSEAVRAIAAYHVGEMGYTDLREPLQRAGELAMGLSHDVVTHALEDLGRAPRERAGG